MKTYARLTAILLAGLSAASASAQKVSIPQPFDVLQGKTSKFKLVADLDMTLFVMNQSLPISGQLVAIQNVRYGARQPDGLAPVTTSFRISKLEGSVMGQSVPELKQSLAGMPELPKVTSFYTRRGELHSLKVSGVPGTRAPMFVKLDPSQMAAMSNQLLMPPAGEVELGVPRVVRQDLSAAGIDGSFEVQILPVEVVRAAGEDAVRFLVTSGDGQVIRFESRGQGLPADIAFSGSASISVSGEMLVGLRSGEPIRQNLDAAVMLTADTPQAPMAGDLRIRLTGFRLQ